MIAPAVTQGFGYVEAGTVTPKAQPGNPSPRLFRLLEDEALINRMGFNNEGMDAIAQRLEQWKASGNAGIVGINLGKNKTSPNTPEDYLTLMDRLYGLSDYLAINISSPNTPNLRDMQQDEALQELLTAIMAKKAERKKETGTDIPILVKIAPDIEDAQKETIASTVLEHKVDGLIVGNTTVGLRDSLHNTKLAQEQGGLSGKPLMELSTQVLGDMYRLTKGKLPLIGVGGISSGEDAYAKIRSGASLVQLYTALVYEGFGVVNQINLRLSQLLERDGFASIKDAVGVDS